MNVIKIKIDFEKGLCQKEGISVVTGDYNSTKIEFEFNESAADGRKIFELKNSDDELVYVDEIVDNEVILVGKREEEGEEKLFSLFNKEGDYTFEVSLYGENSKLTSVYDYITARKEQVIVDGEVVEERITLFDNLMQEITDKIDEIDQAIAGVENLNVDAEKEGTTTTVTITKKDGTPKEVEILDGVSLENMEIQNRDLLVTYGGNANDLGQIEPNVQVGTTTTIAPSLNARVENVGTTLNPVFNFYIPKGEAGSIKFDIVEQLPTEDIELDTIYLVPYAKVTVQELPTENIQANTIYIVSGTGKRYIYQSNQWIEIASDNQYLEYIYVNNQWEELGSIGVDIDLTDYYTKSETNSLLSGKVGFTDYATSSTAGVVKTGKGIYMLAGVLTGSVYDYENYQQRANDFFISKGTLENVITGKGLVSNTDYATDSASGVLKTNFSNSFSVNPSNGVPYCDGKTYEQYGSAGNGMFIGKQTLENVISGKGLVSNVDYASDNIAGTIKTGWEFGTAVNSSGKLYAAAKNYTQYTNSDNSMFISKYTLENVITGKDLTTKSYVDGLVGNLESILETLDVGSGV